MREPKLSGKHARKICLQTRKSGMLQLLIWPVLVFSFGFFYIRDYIIYHFYAPYNINRYDILIKNNKNKINN